MSGNAEEQVPREVRRVVFMAGNLSEGYTPHGPFEDYDAAFEWAGPREGWAMEVYPAGEKDPLLTATGDSFPGDWWGEDSEHTLESWRCEVANDDTRLGYWLWVATQRGELR